MPPKKSVFVHRIVLCSAFFALFALSSLVCCSQTTAEEPAQRFRVGAILPLHGPAADYGVAIKNCIELAKKDRPELFEDIDVIFEDVAYEPSKAVTAFHKLAKVDKVDLIYTWGVSFCKALAPMADQFKIPTVGQCIDQNSSRGKKYFLRAMNYNDEYTRALTDYLNEKGYKHLGVILSEHPYIEDFFDSFQRMLHEGQHVTVIDRLPVGEMEQLRTDVTKLKHGKFDAVGVLVFIGQIGQFYRVAHAQNFTTPTFGTNIFESLTEIASAQGTMNGAVYASTQVQGEFISRYEKTYGNQSQLQFGAPAYEFAIAIAEHFGKRSTRPSPDKIMQEFRSIQNRPGTAAGPYRFVDSELAGKYLYFPIVMKRIENGNIVEIPQK